MNQLAVILMASWMAGLTAFAGAVLAKIDCCKESETKREVIHGIMALGGGLLTSAIALALIPEGLELLSPATLTITFCAGGFLFCLLDIHLSRHGGSKAQFVAMLMDFLPEAISLGAVFGHNHKLGILLAAFIGAQNLPEGFNSFREITASGVSPRKTLSALLGISLLGPIAAASGFFFLQNRPGVTAAIMTFAAGGILYLIFQDIAPQAQMKRHWTPALGAVIGFALGLLGTSLIGI